MATVAQLIDRLREFPPDMEVRLVERNYSRGPDYALPLRTECVQESGYDNPVNINQFVNPDSTTRCVLI